MRMDVLAALGADDGDGGREIGALVARSTPTGGLSLDIGPADGPPLVRFAFTLAEATRLLAAVEAVINGRDEEILMADD